MSTENRLSDQRITELEKELEQTAYDLDCCKKGKDEFIYIASHDLKAPLRKLITFTERLVELAGKELNEEALSCISRIQKNVLSMQSLIDDLSTLSEIEAGIDFKMCDLNEILNGVLETSSAQWQINPTSIHVSALPAIYGDPSYFKLVFKNIIDNAVKFQPEGQVAEIRISAILLTEDEKIKFNLSSENVFYKIKFEDNGIGFNEEDAGRILKPFVRLNGQSSYPGNGIGLAVCDKIIKLHKGIFYAKGIENKGSVFVLILPQFLQ
ncbi:MAG: sensor histidine kinase [Ginsengibacter sp.]